MKKAINILLLTIIPMLFLLSLTTSAAEPYEYIAPKVANDIYKTWTVTFNEELDQETVNDSTVFVKNQFNRNVAVTVALSDDGKNVTVTPSQMYVPDLGYELIVQGVVSTSNEVLSPSVKIPFYIEVLEEEKSTSKSQTMAESSRNQDQASTPEKNPNTNTSTNTAVNNPFGGGSSANPNNQQSTDTSTDTAPPATSQPVEEKPEHLTSISVTVNSLVSNVTVKTSNFVATVKVNGKRMHYQGKGIYELSVPELKSGQTIKVEAFATYEDNSSLERINHKVK